MRKYIPVIIASVFLASCGGKEASKQAELENLKKEQSELKQKIEMLEAEIAAADTSDKEKSKIVSVTAMKPEKFSHYIEVQAKVEGDEDVTVSAESMGSITSVLVRAGDKVSKGQVLATIDDRTIRQNMESLQSQLELATTVFNRQKNLWDQKIGSEIQFLNAKTQKESLEKQVNALREQWDMTRIKSPINGTVDNVHIKTGQTIAPGMPAVRVVNLNELKVTGEVAEGNIAKVQKGNKVKIYFPDTKTEIDAKVDYSGKAINALNRTFNVEVWLKKGSGTFYPNQVAVLKIADYSSDNALVVPVGAIMKSAEGEFVFVAHNGNGKTIAKRQEIKSGLTYNGITEITKGIAVNDKVVTFGYQSLVEGDLISF